MPNATIPVTNLLSTRNGLRINGVQVSFAPNQTIQVDVAGWDNAQRDSIQAWRIPQEFSWPASAPPAPAGERGYSATVDLTVSPQTVNLVPAIAGKTWVTRRTRISVANATGSPTAANVSLKSGGNIMQGYGIDGTGPGPGWNSPIHLAQWSTPTGSGVDISVDTASAGGALSVTVQLTGEYV